jgi:DNA-binding PadR family transcriptional regulator
MTTGRTLSLTAVLVLQGIRDGVEYGFDLVDATGLQSGTVYPALSRLEREGLVRSTWEDDRVARAEGRPARRYYRITAAGSKALAAGIAHHRARLHALVPAGERSRR